VRWEAVEKGFIMTWFTAEMMERAVIYVYVYILASFLGPAEVSKVVEVGCLIGERCSDDQMRDIGRRRG
jgi:hypothetical protein